MSNDPRFPPVSLLNTRDPLDMRQRMPGSPSQYPAVSPIRPSGLSPQGPGMAGQRSAGAPIFDPHHYANVSDLSTGLPDQESLLVLESPPSFRNYLMLRNASTSANVYISFGNTASARSTLVLEPGQIAMFDVVVPQNDMYAFADDAGGLLAFAYSNISG